MILPRIMDVMQNGVAGKSKEPQAVTKAFRQQRITFLEILTEAKAYQLDAGSTLFCDSLVKDFEQERMLMNHTMIPYQAVWIEFDRKELMELPSIKGVAFDASINPAMKNLGATGTEIALLFDNEDPAELCIYAFKNRGPVIVEPLHVRCVPKNDDGSFRYEDQYITGMAAAEATIGITEELLHQDAQTVSGMLHIPLALFALMNAPESGLEFTQKKTEFAARKVKQKAIKDRVMPNVRLPATNTVKLSELGAIHNEAVRQDFGVESTATGDKRASPRRHPVRGSLVWRDGKQHWRRPHYRGSGPGPISVTKVIDDTSK